MKISIAREKVILYPYGFLSIFKPFVESSLDDVCRSLQKAVFSVWKLRKIRLVSMDHRRMLKTGEFLADFQWNRSKTGEGIVWSQHRRWPSALSVIACWNFLDTLAKKLRAKPLMCLHKAAFFTLDLLQICTQYLATKSQL